jgi:hypothetical protein
VDVPVLVLQNYKDPVPVNKAEVKASVNKSQAIIHDVVPPGYPVRILILLQSSAMNILKTKQLVPILVKGLIDSIPSHALLSFAIFDKSIESPSPFTDNRKELVRIFEEQISIPRHKRTALFDSLLEVPALFHSHQPGDTVVFIGDGTNSVSKTGDDKAVGILSKTGVRFFPLFVPLGLPDQFVPALTSIEDLAERAGG